jgi:hypothetical protein
MSSLFPINLWAGTVCTVKGVRTANRMLLDNGRTWEKGTLARVIAAQPNDPP